ncbi:hypothetical protein ANCDUO_03836 [Ancylostoma duodenale]|uniref:non-specific serine/threonine protein kinase n=1 Tax=Ancylostoma duodenale TaxID=51022 RepID=A0A0C2DSV6_9BILA|nr:hypothetical protein ANCDUO_03836 [Ancylostoma duodenale]
MDELDFDSQENSLVHTLPYETMRDLSRVLDGGEAWVELGKFSCPNISDPIWSALQNTLAVPYTELLTATSNFAESNVLGKGGYGVVYVGEWKHTKIAVKRFMTSGNKGSHLQRERLRQSLQELRTLAKYRHDNILPLYAFSLEGPEPCLVYQYMSNGSLEDRLLCRRGTPPLSWLQKKEIAEGSARGLHFLHCIASTPIIHGDVKSANILLDRHFEPKLGDFGLSRDGKPLAFPGLRAYMDSRSPPGLAEYCMNTKNSRKDDWIEALMDRRTPRVSNEGTVVLRLFDLAAFNIESNFV